jgi:hypothetical protein
MRLNQEEKSTRYDKLELEMNEALLVSNRDAVKESLRKMLSVHTGDDDVQIQNYV